MNVFRVIATLGFLWIITACGAEGTTPTPDPEIPLLDAVIMEELELQGVPGGAVAVVKGGEIIHAEGYGYTSLNGNIPVTADTVFRWASISKTVTAVAALQLDEAANDFVIEDPVTKHFTGWPNDMSEKSTITVKQLLSNRSGIIHYANSCAGNTNPSYDYSEHGDIPFDAAKAVNVFDEQTLCFSPGSDYGYSTFGFTLAAAAMESEANVDYAQWVQNNIATPLNMDSLTQGTGSSTGHTLNCDTQVTATEGSKSYVLPGGGWASNIIDLAKFANGILQGTLLEDTERLWTEATGNSGTYRLGINLSTDGTRAWHGGLHDDLRTFMHLYHANDDDVAIVVYLNSSGSNAERVAKVVATALDVFPWNNPGSLPAINCDAP